MKLRTASGSPISDHVIERTVAKRNRLAVPENTITPPARLNSLMETMRAAGTSSWHALPVAGTDPQTMEERSFRISTSEDGQLELSGHEAAALINAAAAVPALIAEIERLRAVVRKGC